jgi:hypothetical protein
LDAADILKLKRGYWVIESRRHHPLDVTLGEDHSRVRNPKAAFALSLFRRVVVSFAQVWLEEYGKINPRCRMTTRKFQKRFLHHDGGPERLRALIFADMRQFIAIAANAFMELIRQPIFLLLMTTSALFEVGLSCVSYFGFGDEPKMVKVSVLAVMLVAGLFSAVMSASASVAREIRSGTALAVLAKPVSRPQFLLAKYAGLALSLVVLTYVNCVAALLATRMTFDAYGDADRPGWRSFADRWSVGLRHWRVDELFFAAAVCVRRGAGGGVDGDGGIHRAAIHTARGATGAQ